MDTPRIRIKELKHVKASSLLVNPKNPRVHPDSQSAVVTELINEIGYADALLAYETPRGLTLFDGHLRRNISGDSIVPVLVTDLSESEADAMLALLDRTAGMAQLDYRLDQELLRTLEMDNAVINDFLELSNAKSELNLDLEFNPESVSSSGMPTPRSPFKPVLYPSDIETLESALFATMKPVRSEALIEVCKFYLDHHK